MKRIGQKGSLTGVLIAAVIGGITMMGLISMMNSAFKSQRHLASKFDIDDVMNRISLFISNGTACTMYLQNKVFDPISSTEVLGDTPAEEFSIYVPGTPTNVIAKKDLQVASKVKIASLTLRNFLRVQGNDFGANLVVDFANDTGNGPREMTRKLTLSLATLPVVVGGVTMAKIVACNSTNQSKGFGNFQVYSASGTFTVPVGVDRIMVEVWGAGGGGGGAFVDTPNNVSAGGGGGGSGGYARSILSVSTGQVYPITVGIGGLAGIGTAAGPGTNGTSGGASSFDNIVTATGGTGGTTGAPGVSGFYGSGGSGSGNEVILGASGTWGTYNYTYKLGAAGGMGGFGPRGIGNGGNGGVAFILPSDRPGRPGGNGRVIVWY